LSNSSDEAGRRPTIKDVAREAGVSFKTVSRVVNHDARVNAGMREAVETAMAALDYRPHRAARALRGNRTYAIALLAGARDEPLQGGAVPFPEYLGEVIAGCTQTCRPAGFLTGRWWRARSTPASAPACFRTDQSSSTRTGAHSID